jgi:regulator of sigma E protease
VRVFPFAGHVHLTNPDAVMPDEFARAPRWRRLCVVAAGPFANMAFALVIFVLFYYLIGLPATPPVITAIEPGSVAEQAGMRLGDRIVSIDGRKIERFEDVSGLVEYKVDRPVAISLLRDGHSLMVQVKPGWVSFTDTSGFRQEHGRYGILATHRALSLGAVASVNGQAVTGRDQARSLLVPLLGKDIVIGLQTNDRTPHDFHVRLDPVLNHDLTAPGSEGYDRIFLGRQAGNIYLHRIFAQAAIDGLHTLNWLVSSTFYIVFHPWHIDWSKITPEAMVAGSGGQVLKNVHVFLYTMALLSVCIGVMNLLPFPGFDGYMLLRYIVEYAVGPEQAAVVYPYAWRMILFLMALAILYLNADQLPEFKGIAMAGR